MEKEKEALLTEVEQLKEEKAIFRNELDERLQEICRLRVGSTLSVRNLMCVATESKAKHFISSRCTLMS